MIEKPLYVRVAEALGCHAKAMDVGFAGHRYNWVCGCDGRPAPHGGYDSYNPGRHIRRYDSDWSAIGPALISYRIGLRPAAGGNWAAYRAEEFGHGQESVNADPLVAACECLLSLVAVA